MTREISFRYNLLRRGAFYGLLRAVEEQTPHVRMQDDAQIKMSFSGTFSPVPVDVDGRPLDVDWLSDEVQPVMVIDGTEYPLGVYIPTTQSVSTDVAASVSIEAYDRSQRVMDTNSAEMLYWPAGTLYLDAVEQLLSAAGISTVFTVPNAAAFTEAREDWPAGTPFLSVVNQLLGEINYKPLWFDARGNAILEPVSLPEASQIKHTLDAADPDTLVLPGISRTRDYFSAANVFEVYVANPDKGANMRAVSVNDSPQSPLSTVRRGRRIVSVTALDNIASQQELQAYADKLRNDSMITGEVVSVSTGLLPGWGVADAVALHVPEHTMGMHTEDGFIGVVAVPEENAICISRAFDMELKVGGRMSHTLEKVVYALE